MQQGLYGAPCFEKEAQQVAVAATQMTFFVGSANDAVLPSCLVAPFEKSINLLLLKRRGRRLEEVAGGCESGA